MNRLLPVIIASVLASPVFASVLGWGVQVETIGSRTVGISWDPVIADCFPGEEYIVQLQVPETPGGPPVKWTTVGSRSYFTGGGGAVVPRTAATISDLQPETNYAVRVVIGGNQSAASAFTTSRDFGGVFSAEVVNSDDLQTSWTSDPDAEGYVLTYRQLDGIDAGWVSTSGLASSYLFSDLVDNEGYLVRIYAELPGGGRTGWAEATVYTGQSAPDPLAASPIAGGPDIRLTWQQVDSSVEFEIERSTWNNESFTPLAKPDGFETLYEDSSTAGGLKYFYRIRANLFPSGNSPWVETCSWSSPPAAPAGLSATEVRDTTIAVGWTALQGIGQYVVERCDPPGTDWEEVGVTNTNSFLDGLATDFPISPNTPYKYRVRGQTLQSFVGDTGNSLVLNVTSAPSPPDPVNAFLNGSETAILIQWQNIAAATGYRLERRVAPVSGAFGDWNLFANLPAGVASDQDAAFTSGQTHQYRVRAESASGASAWAVSPPVTVGTPYPTGVTTTPGSAPGANDCDNAITISWLEVPGADGYKILRGFGSPVEFTVSGGATTSYVDTGLDPNTVYPYQVVATSTSGPDSLPSAISNELTCQFLSASGSGTSVNLSWTALDSPFSEYRIERRNVLTGSNFEEVATVTGRTNTTFPDTATLPDTTYAYRVRGWYAGGGGTFGRYSISDEATTGPPAVTGLQVLGCDENSIRIGWDPAVSADTIRVLRRPGAGGGFSVIATLAGDAVEFDDTGRPSEAAYVYWIFASNENGENASVQLGPVATKFGLDLMEIAPWQAVVSWQPSALPGVANYRVQADSGAGFFTVVTVPAATTSSLRSNLCVGTRFRVQALDSGGGTLSESVVVTYNAFQASNSLSDSTVSDTEIFLEWNAVAGASGYRLQRGPSNTGPWVTVDDFAPGVTSHIDTNLVPDTFYHYRIATLDPCGQPAGFTGGQLARTWDTRESWRRGWWGNGISVVIGSGVYADTADFDRDGCLNIFEFFFGSDPTDPGNCPTARVQTVEVKGEPFYEITWPIRDGALGGLGFDFEVSEDLRTFFSWDDFPEIDKATVRGRTGMLVPPTSQISRKGRVFARLRLNGI